MTEKWSNDAWKTPKYACLNCGVVADAASNSPLETDPRAPQEGDVTVCLQCSHLMVFKADGTVREPNDAELNDIADTPDVLRLLQAMGALRRTAFWRRGHEVLSGAAGKRGVVRAADGAAEREPVPQNRHPKGRTE
jgi:hypothetical protein